MILESVADLLDGNVLPFDPYALFPQFSRGLFYGVPD